MKLENLTPLAQKGLLQWANDVHCDELFLEEISGSPEDWSWIWFQLRESEDKPEWFPRGKWATLQVIEALLIHEARVLCTTTQKRSG